MGHLSEMARLLSMNDNVTSLRYATNLVTTVVINYDGDKTTQGKKTAVFFGLYLHMPHYDSILTHLFSFKKFVLSPLHWVLSRKFSNTLEPSSTTSVPNIFALWWCVLFGVRGVKHDQEIISIMQSCMEGNADVLEQVEKH